MARVPGARAVALTLGAAIGVGRVATRGSRIRRHAGVATGIYEDGELDALRDEWESLVPDASVPAVPEE
jgi:hypothetical protein